ncbi:hypothetical protein DFN09_002015 [Clostridium acetobutylicum]|nr:hypothetical protein [Clostridium acetobutylicum]
MTKEVAYIMNFVTKITKNHIINTIIIAIAAIILLVSLSINPIIGKHDNGDFGRLMIYGGIDNLSNAYKDIYDGFLHIKYSTNPLNVLLLFYNDWTSCSIPVKISVILFLILHKFTGNLFDIRYLSFVYSILFLMGLYLIINFKKLSTSLKIICGSYMILFFTSTCYVEYFNSFFEEAGTIVFFLLCIGTYLNLIEKSKPQKRDFVYFFVASAFFLTAKAQNLPMLPFMLIIYLSLYLVYNKKKLILISSIFVIFLCIISYFSLTKVMNENNIYQSVFSGVLRDSKTPTKDLTELGLDKKLVVFKGHSFYNKNNGLDPLSNNMLKNFYPNISNWKILFFYLKHQDRMWQKIVDASNSNYRLDKPYSGNFVKGQYSKNKHLNTFRSYLISKFPYIHHNVYLFIIFSLIYFTTSVIYAIKSKDVSIKLLNLMLIFILITGSSQFILPVIGAGHGDFSKHLFLLNFSYDIMFGVALLWFSHIISNIFLFHKHNNYFTNK